MAHHTTRVKILKAIFAWQGVLEAKISRRSGFAEQGQDLVGTGHAFGLMLGEYKRAVEENLEVAFASLFERHRGSCVDA